MAIATKELMLGLPPDMQEHFERMTPEMRHDWIIYIAKIDRKKQRQYNSYRKYVLQTEGVDVGPYKSLYQSFWDMYRREQRKALQSQAAAILGLELDANTEITKREVKNAYRRKARKLHPDVGGDAESFKQLYAAYRDILKVAIA
jgi:hypothetical protein